MSRNTSTKVQTYLSSEDPVDAEIAHFLGRFTRGRRTAGAVREMLYVAWAEMGAMSREAFESRFKNIDYDDFRKRYPTSRPRSVSSAEPVIERTAATRSGEGGKEPSKKRIRIKPPTAK